MANSISPIMQQRIKINAVYGLLKNRAVLFQSMECAEERMKRFHLVVHLKVSLTLLSKLLC